MKVGFIIGLVILLGSAGILYVKTSKNPTLQAPGYKMQVISTPSVVSPTPIVTPETKTQLQGDIDTDVQALQQDATAGNKDSVNDTDLNGL